MTDLGLNSLTRDFSRVCSPVFSRFKQALFLLTNWFCWQRCRSHTESVGTCLGIALLLLTLLTLPGWRCLPPGAAKIRTLFVSELVSFPDFTTHISIRHSFFPVPADSWPAQQISLGHHSRSTLATGRACSATPRWQLALQRQRTVPFSSTCFLISGKVRTFAAGKFWTYK